MGDAADYLIDSMEQGESILYDKIEDKEVVIDNMSLMYTSFYDNEDRYEIVGEVDEHGSRFYYNTSME
jgi:hypothetical protein